MNSKTLGQIGKNQVSEVVTVDEVANLIAQLPVEVKAVLFMGSFGRENRRVIGQLDEQAKRSSRMQKKKKGFRK